MTTRQQIEVLEAKKIQLAATMRNSDDRAAKCAKLGLSFADTYPLDYDAYVAANKRYNEVEEELNDLYTKLAKEEAEQEQMKEGMSNGVSA